MATASIPAADLEFAIRIKGLRTAFGPVVVHDDLDLDVKKGEILGIVGGSGTGKSVLLRTIIGLNRAAGGEIEVLGQTTGELNDREQRALRRRWGVLFQDGALFSSLTVSENVQAPMREHTTLSPGLRVAAADLKVALAGLPPDACSKFPSELSGGMRKRAGLARALSLDPDILFLDEPTAGLDPIGAANFDQLILELRQALGLTVVMITHDLDSLHAICDRVAVLIDKKTKVDTIPNLMQIDHPWIQEYFGGPRGRAAIESGERRTADPVTTAK